MSQEASRKVWTKQSEIVQQLEIAKQTVLVSAFVQDYIKSHPVSDEVLTKEYNNLKISSQQGIQRTPHPRGKESDAKSIAAKLKKGGKDNISTSWQSNSRMSAPKSMAEIWLDSCRQHPTAFVKQFGDALMNLNKGQVSEPIQSQFGWHIIKLDDVRDLKLPPLDE